MVKTILITGASSGIGKATAKYFLEKGWNVAATMRSPDKNDLKETSSLKKYRLDVTDIDSIKDAVKHSIKDFGKIDVLLNNAGYGAFGPMESATNEQIKNEFDVNVFGLLNVTRGILPHMRENKSGIIINISSVGGKITMPLGSLYHGTKFCVEGISESLNYELNSLGIKVKIVEPGGVKTDFGGRSLVMFENSIEDYKPLVTKMKKLLKRSDVMPSMPEDIAKVIYKAVISKNDKMRYVAGKDAKIMLFVNKLFGTKFLMNFIKKRFGI